MDGDVDFKRLMCVNVVAYTLAPGEYNLETFEPYGLEFLKLMVLSGECEVDHVYIREYAASDIWTADFHCSDAELNELFRGGQGMLPRQRSRYLSGQPHARARRMALRSAILGECRSTSQRAHQS